MTKDFKRSEFISIHALREEGDRPARPPERRASRFLSTPSARRATDLHIVIHGHWQISIHALREEGDRQLRVPQAAGGDISIHALREEGDRVLVDVLVHRLVFLSTPSARRATDHVPTQDTETGISIHALREEGDACKIRRKNRPV